MTPARDLFDIRDRVAVITGGAGLLGQQHAEAIASAGGIPVLLDLPRANPKAAAERLRERSRHALGCEADITREEDLVAVRDSLLKELGRVDILVNNAANNPAVGTGGPDVWTRVESFPMTVWERDIAVGLTGAFLCCKIFGTEMAKRGRGVILNIASDLSVISPDQRLYRREGVPNDRQPVKPASYSVVKTGLVGLTRYLATYWADRGVRVNALSPGGVFAGQPEDFVARLVERIPLGRMARVDEYHGVVLFLCSDASSYLTGANVVIDGGRSCW